MKIKSFLLLAAVVVLASASVFAQPSSTSSTSVWAVDFVKTRNGQQANYLKFIEQNWARARAFMKEKGIVSSYQVLSLPASEASDWDVLLMTRYKDPAAYEKREAVFNEFAEYRKTQPQTGDKINAREISEIRFNRTFTQPISSETAKMMLAVQTTDAELAAARIPLEIYIKAHAGGDGSNLDKSFYPEAKIQGIAPADGKLISYAFKDYVKTFPGKPAPDEAARTRRIERLEITKNAAVAKLVFDYPSIKITDYLLLLKIDGEWKIVNKIAQGEPKTPALK